LTRWFAQIFQSKKEGVKTERKEKNSKFNVVSKRDSVLIPDHGSPAGWINRIHDRAENVSNGESWRSAA
jgi:hypothetical protein